MSLATKAPYCLQIPRHGFLQVQQVSLRHWAVFAEPAAVFDNPYPEEQENAQAVETPQDANRRNNATTNHALYPIQSTPETERLPLASSAFGQAHNRDRVTVRNPQVGNMDLSFCVLPFSVLKCSTSHHLSTRPISVASK